MKRKMRIGFWNVRTLREAGKLRQLESEMENYRLDILGISEVRWTDFGEVQTQNGNSFLYSGQTGDEAVHRSGVGLLLSKKVKKSLIKWEPKSHRILIVRMKGKIRNITIIQCYAPTEAAEQQDKDEFYACLNNTIREASQRDIKIIMGDFNAKVGSNNEGLEHIMGSHGVGDKNNNGDLFIDLCADHDLVIGGTMFPHRTCHKVTWVSPDSVTENQIDHIAVSRKFRSSLLNVRNKRGADIGSDHHLVLAEFRLKISVRKAVFEPKGRKLDVAKLKVPFNKESFTLQLRNRFEALTEQNDNDINEGIEGKWKKIKEAYVEVGESVLGFRNLQKKEWMSEETWEKVKLRKALKQKLNQCRTRGQKIAASREYSECNRRVKNGVRKDKRKWIDEQAKAAEEAARIGDSGALYKITKKLSKKNFGRDKPVKNKDGVLLTDVNEQLRRWEEHFRDVFSARDDSEHPQEQTAQNLDVEPDQMIELECPSRAEIECAVRNLKSAKAAGIDNIPPELLKVDEDTTVQVLCPLFEKIWREEKIPLEWKKGIIVKLPKKGDLTNCNNWRGITLLSVPSKVLSLVILNRIKESVEVRLRKEQAGFRSSRSCVDLINTLRIILEQSKEFQATLYLAFVDFEKAFDSVKHCVLWHVLQQYGIPPKILNIIKELYDGFQCQVLHQGKLSNAIPVTSGVRQGCILSPTLFLIILDNVMRKVTSNRRRGIQWGLRERLEDLDYADDLCLLAQRFTDMKFKLESLKIEAEAAGLKINTAKTKELRVNAARNVYERLQLGNEQIEAVDTFLYLGSVVAADGGAAEDVKSRIRKANAAFVQLYPVWRNRNISKKTKLRIFNTNVKSVLLYASETWKMDKKILSQLQVFCNRCLRRIMDIWWPNTISNEDLWKATGQRRIELQIRERKWRWLGHTLRKADEAIEKKALEWTPQGTRKRGRPSGTWKRTVMREATGIGLTWGQLRGLAQDRDGWRVLLEALCST